MPRRRFSLRSWPAPVPAFSAGGAFTLVERVANDPQLRTRNWKEARVIIYNMLNCSKPIVSAIKGSAAGAGLACVLLAEISMAAKETRLVDTRVANAAQMRSAGDRITL